MRRITEPVLLVLFLGVALAVALKGISIVERETRQASGYALQTVLQTTDESLALWSSGKIRDVNQFASREDIKELSGLLVQTAGGAKADPLFYTRQLREAINPAVERLGYNGFFIISRDYINLSSMRDGNIGSKNLIAKQRPDLLRRVFDGETLIIPTLASDVPLAGSGQNFNKHPPTMFVAAPIHDSEESIYAIITLRIDPIREFSSITALGRIGSSGETYAFDRDGWLLTESRFTDQMRSLGLIKRADNSALSVHILDPGHNLVEHETPRRPEADLPMTVMAMSATQGNTSKNTRGYRDYRGVPVMGAWLWHEELNIGLTTEIDVNEALEPYYLARNVILGGYIATALLSILVVIYLVFLRTRAVRDLESSKAILEDRVMERTQSLVEINDRMQDQIIERVVTEEQLKQTKARLEDSNRKLEEVSMTDGLTGIPNRRAFDMQFETEWKRCHRQQVPLALIMFDIDFFKPYNDTYGHQAGDNCLKKVAEILKITSIGGRAGDLLARYGGEEFAVILSGCELKDALTIAEKIGNNVALLEIEHETTRVADSKHLTLSIGVSAQVPTDHGAAHRLLSAADKALYQAKASGRNQVIAATSLSDGKLQIEEDILKLGRR